MPQIPEHIITRRKAAGHSFARLAALSSEKEIALRGDGYVVTRKVVGSNTYSLVAWPRTHQ